MRRSFRSSTGTPSCTSRHILLTPVLILNLLTTFNCKASAVNAAVRSADQRVFETALIGEETWQRMAFGLIDNVYLERVVALLALDA